MGDGCEIEQGFEKTVLSGGDAKTVFTRQLCGSIIVIGCVENDTVAEILNDVTGFDMNFA